MANDELMYEPKVRELLKGGEYLFYCVNVELIDNPYAKEDQDPKQIRLTFNVEKEPGVVYRDGDGTPHSQWGYMGRVLGYRKDGTPYKTQVWCEAILMERIDPNLPFDFRRLLNCRVIGKIEDTKADGVTPTNTIDKLKPFTGDLPPVQRDPQKPKPVVLNPNGTGLPPSNAVGTVNNEVLGYARRFEAAKQAIMDSKPLLGAAQFKTLCANLEPAYSTFAKLTEREQGRLIAELEKIADRPGDYEDDGSPAF